MKIGFIGAGQMAQALAAGFVRAGLVAPGDVCASDPAAAARSRFAEAVSGACLHEQNAEVAAQAEVLILAVKPQYVPAALADLRAHLSTEHLLISIVAGIPLRTIAEQAGGQVRIARVMPNTPCLVGQSASGYCLGRGSTSEDAQLVDRLLSAVGKAFCLDEKLLDAVTGLSGSGPAFVYQFIEALADGGVLSGLPRQVATVLAAQTVLGAAQMVLQTGDHPGVLKDRVASPAGTTIAGLAVLERGGVRSAVMDAVAAATERSRQLAGDR